MRVQNKETRSAVFVSFSKNFIKHAMLEISGWEHISWAHVSTYNKTSSQFFCFDDEVQMCTVYAFSATSAQKFYGFCAHPYVAKFPRKCARIVRLAGGIRTKWLEIKKKSRTPAGWGSSPCILRDLILPYNIWGYTTTLAKKKKRPLRLCINQNTGLITHYQHDQEIGTVARHPRLRASLHTEAQSNLIFRYPMIGTVFWFYA